jgi:7,8-dihydropterin-6-yl-methyl-4-(beta-D-ribofuranosyl)aminobenzene 5'-phosphate synthase
MHTLNIAPKDIETIILSHGHFDHTTGLDGLARTLGRTNLPVMIHPDFWNRRRTVIPGRDPFEFPTTSKSALQDVGFDVIEERQPSFLLNNALLVTGEVDRTSAFEHGMPGQQAFRGGTWTPDPLIRNCGAKTAGFRHGDEAPRARGHHQLHREHLHP